MAVQEMETELVSLPRCRSAGVDLNLKLLGVALLCAALFIFSPLEGKVPAGRIVFLGDSITHDGHYIAILDAYLSQQRGASAPELINLGLPSETCSGLSEPDHPFPRPDVHERLERALTRARPSLVVACYGMNDGIYHPFSAERFATFQRGVNKLIDKVHAAGAKLVLMTPPAFDPLPMRKRGKLLPAGKEKYAWFAIYEGYDEVLARYAEWVLAQKERVEMVIDLHSPVAAYLLKRRAKDPDFVLSGDGVHLNAEGHEVLAAAILGAWDERADPAGVDPRLLELAVQRQKILHNAWLSHVGHKRPGMKAGLTLADARKRAAAIETKMRARVNPMLEFAVRRLRQDESGESVKLNVSLDNALPKQGFAIESDGDGWRVRGADDHGMMYGVLDLAESLRLGLSPEKTSQPKIHRRGLKFNIPLDARCPSYDDSGTSAVRNIPQMWDREFWHGFLDEMAEHRYNVLSLWSNHPFTTMVKLDAYASSRSTSIGTASCCGGD